MNPNVSCGLWMIITSLCGFTDFIKCTTLVGDADNRRGFECVWVRDMWELFIPSMASAVNLKLLSKNKVVKKKELGIHFLCFAMGLHPKLWKEKGNYQHLLGISSHLVNINPLQYLLKIRLFNCIIDVFSYYISLWEDHFWRITPLDNWNWKKRWYLIFNLR